MRRLAELLTDLAEAPHQAARMKRLVAYFETSDDIGWSAAWLTGALKPPRQTPAKLRAMAEARVDAELFRISAAQIGDIGETVALIWPGGGDASVETIATWDKPLPDLLDQLEAEARVAAIRLHTHRKARGVRAAEVHRAIGHVFAADPALIAGAMIEEAPPYPRLTAWLKGEGPAPNWAPPRPPELPRRRPETGSYAAWPLPDGAAVCIEDGRAFDSDGAEKPLKTKTPDGWGFWTEGRVIFPEDAPPLNDPEAAHREGAALLIRDDAGDWSIWPAEARLLVCPVTFIESSRVVAVTLGVMHGEDIAPLIKLPAPDAAKVSAFARKAMVDKFGPVRQVGPGLWAEVSYEQVTAAPRRKIGVALSGAQITRLIWEDGPPPPATADLK